MKRRPATSCPGPQLLLWPEALRPPAPTREVPEYFACPSGCTWPDGAPVYLEMTGQERVQCEECGGSWPWGRARLQVLALMQEAIRERRRWPTCRELAAAVGVSVRAIQHYLTELREAGLLPAADQLTHAWHTGLRTGWACCAQGAVQDYEAALRAPYGRSA